MLLDIIKQFNWFDIFFLIILIRSTYVAVKRGIFVSIFNLLGTVLACYFSLHYFTKMGDFFERHIPMPPRIPLEIFDLIAFFILTLFGYAVMIILREALARFVKAETISFLNKWGSAIVGSFRGLIICSLVVFAFSIPVIDYFGKSVRNSFFARRTIHVSVGIYSFLWSKIDVKFRPREEFNNVVLEVQEEALSYEVD